MHQLSEPLAQFVKTLSAGVLLAWLIDAMEDLGPSVLQALQERLEDARAEASELGAIAYLPEELVDLSDWIEAADAPPELEYMGLGLSLTLVHTALEVLVRELESLEDPGKPWPGLLKAIEGRLQSMSGIGLDRESRDRLTDLVQTRNLIVHKRGVVDEDYLKRVPTSQFQVQERRLLSLRDVLHFAAVVETLGRKLALDAPAL